MIGPGDAVDLVERIFADISGEPGVGGSRRGRRLVGRSGLIRCGGPIGGLAAGGEQQDGAQQGGGGTAVGHGSLPSRATMPCPARFAKAALEIGRAARRERVWTYV